MSILQAKAQARPSQASRHLEAPSWRHGEPGVSTKKGRDAKYISSHDAALRTGSDWFGFGFERVPGLLRRYMGAHHLKPTGEHMTNILKQMEVHILPRTEGMGWHLEDQFPLGTPATATCEGGNRLSALLQGSLHYTPEHCLVNGGFPLLVEKAMSQMGKMYLLRSPAKISETWTKPSQKERPWTSDGRSPSVEMDEAF